MFYEYYKMLPQVGKKTLENERYFYEVKYHYSIDSCKTYFHMPERQLDFDLEDLPMAFLESLFEGHQYLSEIENLKNELEKEKSRNKVRDITQNKNYESQDTEFGNLTISKERSE